MKTVIYIFSFIVLSQNAKAIPNFENELQERVRLVRNISALNQLNEQRDLLIQLRRSCEIENSSQEIPLNCYKYLSLLKKYKILGVNFNSFENDIELACEKAVHLQKMPFSEIKTAEISSFKCRERVREKNAEILYIQQSNYK